MRADQLLVRQGKAPSRTQAQKLIEAGRVFYFQNDERIIVNKPSQELSDDTILSLTDSDELIYVSRGGLKLKGALEQLEVSVDGLFCLDVGLSTGGFSDCLLQSGAKKVVGVDVGREQLHNSLKANNNLKWFDKINARHLSQHPEVLKELPDAGVDFIVMDVSFISITLIVPELFKLLKPKGHLLSLVKPQFELTANDLSRGGIVKDPALYETVENKIRTCLTNTGFEILNYISSPITGGDGNHEFFIFAKKN